MEVLIGVMILLSIMGGVLHYLDLGVTKKLIQYGSDTVFLLQHEWLEQKKRNEGKKIQKVKDAADKRKKVKVDSEAFRKVLAARRKNKNTLSGLTTSQSEMLAQIRSRATEWNHEINASVEVGPNVTVTKSGGRHVDVGKLLSSPKVQKQLKAMDKLFKGEVLRALKFGKEPPLLVGKGIYTKKTLKRDWNDEWQAIANDLDIHLWGKPKVKVGSPGLAMPMSPLSEDFFARPSPPTKPPPPPKPPSTDRLVQQKLKLEIEKLKLQKENLMRMEIMEQKSAAEQKAANDHAALTNKIFSQSYEEQEGITIDKDGMWRGTGTRGGGPR
jgi:hypothetical protein